jgi:hypothetical protein
MNRNTAAALVAATLLGYAGSSSGYTPLIPKATSFSIVRLYSDASGDSQFIELEESAGQDGAQSLSALVLGVTNRYGVTKQITFTHDLPAGKSARRHVIVVSDNLAAAGPPGFADYVMPNQTLPTDGGTLVLSGNDAWSYDALPGDGSSVTRDGFADTSMRNASGATAYAGSGSQVIYEFYNATLDHYFMSGSQPDIDALDTGRIAGWSRTGEVLYTPAQPLALTTPVCRYYVPDGSHFFSASPAECGEVGERFPKLVLETPQAFLAWLPSTVTGNCPLLPEDAVTVDLVPVFRLWNGRADTNHRYTTDPSLRERMIADGRTSEGHGPLGTAFCVASTAAF